jgi:hypothetical protein
MIYDDNRQQLQRQATRVLGGLLDVMGELCWGAVDV